MTIQQLAVFLAVCEELNFTRAAACVYMSRQAVRQNIAELERELSGALFQNEHNRLVLTAKGELLRSKAAPLVAGFQELQRSMNADIRIGRALCLGVSVSLIPDYLPNLERYLRDFFDSYPNLPVETLPMENDEAVPALLGGAVDACLVMDTGRGRPGTVRTQLTEHPLAVLLKARLFPRGKRGVEAAELDGLRLFVPGQGEEFAPLFEAIRRSGATIDFQVMPSFYQVLFHVLDHDGMAINRYDPRESVAHGRTQNLPFRGMPPLCCSFIERAGEEAAAIALLRDWLAVRLREEFGS